MEALFQGVYKAIDEDRMPPVCFIVCADKSLAGEAALLFAGRFCAVDTPLLHPDFFDLCAPFAIEELRGLLRELSKRSFAGGKRCVRLRDAHLMSEQGQNLLLKTLEEPPPQTLFLLCGHYAAMLPTVRSRCAALRLGLGGPEQIAALLQKQGVEEKEARLYAGVALRYEQALELCKEEEARAFRSRAFDAFCGLLDGSAPFAAIRELRSDRKAAQTLAAYWLSFARDLLACRFSLPAANADFASKLSLYGARFTSGRINGMIEMLANALARLQSNVSPGAVLDALATQMLEDKTKREK